MWKTSEEAKQLMGINGSEPKDLPVLFLEDGTHLKKPHRTRNGGARGSEPAGEGRDVRRRNHWCRTRGVGGFGIRRVGRPENPALSNASAPGGQAGTSSRIENYLGFPSGLSGSDLARAGHYAGHALWHRVSVAGHGKSHQRKRQLQNHRVDDDTEILARAVVITTGVDYRKLDTKGIADFTGAGVYYGAATTEASACKDKEVYVVGGGNSAGQAAMYLAKFAKNVHILIRKEDLTATMSSYLIDQIAGQENIHVLGRSEIVEAGAATNWNNW